MMILKRTLNKNFVDPASLMLILEDYVDKNKVTNTYVANSYISELALLDLFKICRIDPKQKAK